MRYQINALELIKSGFAKYSKGFRLLTSEGIILVLSPEFANDLRNDKRLDLGGFFAEEFHAHMDQFAGFRPHTGELIRSAVKVGLQRQLASLSRPLSDEAADSLRKNWGDQREWHEVETKAVITKCVAQLSNKAFIGNELCRDPKWLEITVDYALHMSMAAITLHLFPKTMRGLAARFLPVCRTLQRQVDHARLFLDPFLKMRQSGKAGLTENRLTTDQHYNALDWVEENASFRPYDPVIVLLMFSMAAVHTTSDMLTQVIYDLCGREGLVHALREEIISVIPKDGWSKASFYNLKLMDSVIKESQRLKPSAISSMSRITKDRIILPDGSTIPKGMKVTIAHQRMWDPSIYPDASEFDGYRFYKLRDASEKGEFAQLVSTGPDHLGFGHGEHACPGRFFAANVAKTILCHILLKYDFCLLQGSRQPTVLRFGRALVADQSAKIAIRRRKEEFSLELGILDAE